MPIWKNDPSGAHVAPAAAESSFWFPAELKSHTEGTKSIPQLWLPYPLSFPVVLPEEQPCVPPLWRKLHLVPATASG